MQAIPAPLAIGRPIPGATAGSILFAGAGGVLTQDNANLKWGPAAGQGLTLNAGTATTAVSPLSISQTWNAAGTTFPGFKLMITDTASAAGSLAFQILGGASGTTVLAQLRKDGSLYGGVGFATNASLEAYHSVAAALARTVSLRNMLIGIDATGISWAASYGIWWSSTATGSGDCFSNRDSGISRISAGLLGIGSGSAGSFAGSLRLTNIVGQAGYHEMAEITAPAAPTTNNARIYAEDNGSGKTRIMVLFPTGAAQQLAIEP